MLERKESEEPRNILLDRWLAEVKARWQHVPHVDIDPTKLQHIAIICDGNRRSAVQKNVLPEEGYILGLEVLKGMAMVSRQWGVKAMTFWLWSTENWSRKSEQVNSVMSLAGSSLNNSKLVEELSKYRVKFTHFGRKDRLPKEIVEGISRLEQSTLDYDQHYLNVAIDYGGAEELATATRKIVEDILIGKINKEDLKTDPDIIFRYLYTKGQTFPDLIIRTGVNNGEIPRTSGFMPLQSNYACWQFLPVNFPDLTPQSFAMSVNDFSKYDRRMGK